MKFFTSEMLGAPTMNGAAGAMVSVLDACLCDGFGLKSASSLTVADGIATVNFTGGTAAVVGSTILVAGVTSPASLNGEKRVLSASSTQITFATSAPDGSASGSITFKMAALGWTKSFAGTNQGVYRPSSPEATGCYLRVDDTGTTTCRVAGYESMQNINSGSGRFPLATQVSDGLHWAKSSAADTTARTWACFGDEQFFALYVKPSDNKDSAVDYGGVLFGFGDIVSLKSGDAYSCALFGGESKSSATQNYQAGDLGYASSVGDKTRHGFVARAATGVGGSQAISKHSPYLSTQSGLGNQNDLTYPNTTDNGLLVSRVDVRGGSALRGKLPGVYHTPQYIGAELPTFAVIDGTGEFAGRRFMVVQCGYTANTYRGPTFLDITGPWR